MENKMAAVRMMMLGEGTGNQTVGAGQEEEEDKFWDILPIANCVELGIVVLS